MGIRLFFLIFALPAAIVQTKRLISLNFLNSSNERELKPIVNVVTTILNNFTLHSFNTVDFTLGTIELFQSSAPYILLQQIIEEIAGKLPYRISDVSSIDGIIKRSHNVFLVKDYGSVHLIWKAMNNTLFNYRGYYVIAFSDAKRRSFEIFKRIFTQFFNLYILNVIILSKDVNAPNVVNVYTYFPFASDHCHKAVPKLYNRFIDGKFEKDLDIFPDKVVNFYGCHFREVCWHNPPVMDLKKFHEGRIHPEGIDGNILKILASKLNFTWSILMEKNNPDLGVIYENGTSTGAMRLMIEGDGNFSVCGALYTFDRSRVLLGSINYYYTTLVFVVAPREVYSSLYRIFFPFSSEIWCLIGIVFIVAWCIIFAFNFFLTKYRVFIVGERNSSPYLHMFSTAIGGALPSLPGHSFARNLLIFWTISTAVLRTSYQGVLFTFLQQKEYRASPRTIKGMLDSGYLLYVPPAAENIIEPIAPNSKYVYINGDAYKYFDQLYDRDFRGIILQSELNLKYYNSRNWSKPFLRALPEKVGFFSMSVLFKKDSYLKEPFDRILRKFMGSGLIRFWASKSFNRTRIPSRFRKQGPPKITSSDLEGCYRFCSFLLLSSVALCFIEKMSLRIPRLKRFLEMFFE